MELRTYKKTNCKLGPLIYISRKKWELNKIVINADKLDELIMDRGEYDPDK